jgi:hypothetical protein
MPEELSERKKKAEALAKEKGALDRVIDSFETKGYVEILGSRLGVGTAVKVYDDGTVENV